MSQSLTRFVPRPDKGTSGQPITVKINIFPITAMADTLVHQYDVTFIPDLPPSLYRKAWKSVDKKLKDISSQCIFVYDGRKIAYSTHVLADTTLDVEFSRDDTMDLSIKGAVIPIKPTTTSKAEKIQVKLRKVATANFHELLLHAQGKLAETENVLQSSNVLSVYLHHVPSMLFVPVGSNFFTPEDRVSLSGGIEVWKGYHQSVRIMMAGHLGVNVDIASSIFRKGGISVIDYLLDVLNVKDISQLGRINNAKIQEHLKGVNVVTIHRGDMKIRFKISKISTANCDQHTFEHDGKKTNVTNYFKSQYGIKLRFPFLPLALKADGKTAFPLEILSIIPAQRFLKKLSGDQTSDLIRATVQKPLQRAQNIQNAVKNILKYQENQPIKSLGLEISNEMMSVPARILPAPKVVFSANKSASGKDGAWNLKGFKFVNPQTVSSCGFIFFTKIKREDAVAVRTTLLKKWSEAGINIKAMDAPVMVVNPFERGAIRGSIRKMFDEAQSKYKQRIQLMVCVIDKEPKNIYEEIKRTALLDAGIITQCLLSKNVRSADFIKDQYAANVALKVNIKLGGANNFVDRLPMTDRPTIIFGADVTHPQPGSAAPSVAAIVASTDKNMTKYHTYLRAQKSRVEIIEDLKNVVIEAIKNYTNQGVRPTSLIFFRDGVSVGQFAQVHDIEIKAIKDALVVLKIQMPITFIIVQKRHHLRIFPEGGRSDKSGNCLPGTIIDSHVVHPIEFNFLLQSHAGIQGTSRGTIYHVLYDEQKMKSNDLQQLCYNLCFLSERATRSISIVAPAYRAHIAAYYGRMFVEGGDNASVASGESTVGWRNVNPNMQQTMYYM